MEIEQESEVADWFDGLPLSLFAHVVFHIDRLAQFGPSLRMPHSRALGDGLFELRFDLESVSWRVSYFFPGDGRIVLLTVFHKQRNNERQEIFRARVARKVCIEQHGEGY
jgi:phage-related protein